MPNKTDTLNALLKDIDELYSDESRDYQSTTISAEHVKKYYHDSYFRNRRLINRVSSWGCRKKILDIGIAYGFYAIHLKKQLGYDVTGAELPDNIDKYCLLPRKYDIPVIPFDISRPDTTIADESYDIVIFSEILEHLRMSPLKVLLELKRLLKPGGRLILTTPNIARFDNIIRLMLGRNIVEPFPLRDENLRHITDAMMHIREYTMAELATLLDQAGFTMIRRQYLLAQELASWRFCTGITKKLPRLLRLALASIMVPWRSILLITGQKT